MSTVAPREDLRLSSPSFKAVSHAVYSRLRSQTALCRVPLPRGDEAFVLTRHADISAFLKDPRFAKDPANAMTARQLSQRRRVPSLFAPLMRNMLDRDDPDHARLRRLVHATFTARRVEQLEERTLAICDSLLDALVRRPSFDLIDDFALPLPVTVICDLLGVPVRDRTKFARWSKTLISVSMTPVGMLVALPRLVAFVRYLRHLIRSKRAAPQDDLISALVQQQEASQAFDEDELLAMVAILLTAGHETTTNLIGNGVLALLEQREAFDRLRLEPTSMKTAVEELLRFGSPVEMSTNRYAISDLALCGVPVPKGSLVLASIASANRDEEVFEQPHTLDVGRPDNRHLTFGLGGHYCVGAPLARMEGRIAIDGLLRRLPDLRLLDAKSAPRWRRGMVLRGLTTLPVATRSSRN